MTVIETSAFLHNLVVFGRFLRRAGLRVDPARQAELARALSLIDMGRRADFRQAAPAVVVTRREGLAVFGPAFNGLRARRPGPVAPRPPFSYKLLILSPG